MSFKDKQLIFWTVTLCVGMVAWLVYDIKAMHIYYQRFQALIDPVTGEKRKPVDMFDLAKIINQTDEYINSTNAQERLFDLQYNLNFENPFTIALSYTSEDQLRMSAWPVANQTKCGHQLGWIQTQLNENRNYSFVRGRLGLELTKLMDSFGRPESNLFSGSITWLGSYEQCKRLQLDNKRIKMRYCLAHLRFKWWPKTEPRSNIRMGICLPETCDTSSFGREDHKRAIDTLMRFDLPDFYKNSLEFDSLFCLPDERSPIRQIPPSGYIYLSILLVWVGLVFIGTIIYEICINGRKNQFEVTKQADTTRGANAQQANTVSIVVVNEKQQVHQVFSQSRPSDASLIEKSYCKEILEAVSIRCSLKSFKKNEFHVKYNEGERVRVDLSVMDFIKVLMAILVILGHSAYLGSLYSRSLSNRIEINTSIVGRMSVSVGRCVDTFFFFFGVLTAYTLMRKFSPKQLANPLIWFGVNMGVLLRISPVFMLVYWYSKTISPYTGDGPWWDYGVHKYSMKGVCMSDPWWRSIPYFGSSDGLPAPACNLPGWFIVSYAQISIILPLITYLICKLPNYRLRCSLISFVTILSASEFGIKIYNQSSFKVEDASLFGGFLVDLLEKFESTGFMSTFSRLGSVTIGCFAGYLLRRYELGDIVEWPAWVYSKKTLLLTVVGHLVIVFMPIIGHKAILWTNHVVHLEEFVYTNILMAIVWPILNTIALLNATTVYNHYVATRFFANSFWHIFNRLGLCIYLVHWEVLFVGMTNFEHAPTYGFVADIMKMWSFGVFYSLMISFILHIFVEAPLSNLLMLLARHLGPRPSAQKDNPPPSPLISTGLRCTK